MSKGRKSVRTKSVKRDGKTRQTAHLEHIPFRLREIMKSKEMMKLGVTKRKAMLRGADLESFYPCSLAVLYCLQCICVY